MRRLFFLIIAVWGGFSLSAQPFFDGGLKGGVNTSEVVVNLNEFNSDMIVRTHIGFFARLGIGAFYLQPEAYFISKGGDILQKNVELPTTRFDLNNIDIPLLLGAKIIEGDNGNLRLMAGPIFSFLTSAKVRGDDLLTSDYYKNNYYGYQYGIGVDLWSFFIDLRFEQGANRFYYEPDLNFSGKNRTYMVTFGVNLF